MSLREPTPIDPEVGIPDLIRRLTDDSKRLASDEVRLAKLELAENFRAAARGTMWVAVAFGVGVVALTAATIFVASLIGRLAAGHMWVGALVTGVIELVVAFVLLRKGVAEFTKPSYTFEETRESLKDTQAWVAAQRAD
ncbi:MAG: phage holin family protein [Gemmatimonadaceae bacterium]